MKFRKLLFIVGLSAAWSTIALSAGPLQGSSVPPRLSHDFDIPIAGNPRTLDVKYERWKAAIDENESDLIVGLMWSKGLSNGERVGLVGRARIDIYRGTVSVELSGTEAGDSYDVWLVDNGRGPGASVVVTADDRLVRLGRLRDSGGSAVLEAKMPPAGAAGFTLDQVVVAEAGRSPAEGGGILFGSPTLFQRRFMAELQESSIRLAVRINPVAPSSGGTTCESPLEEQVALGERLFFEETFNGNGRACGSCHPATNNFTLDPIFIATLPPDDPLFVAEDPESPLHYPNEFDKRFEIPQLMRSHGLILENVDGFPPLDEEVEDRFTMRGVNHLFGLELSMNPEPGIGQDEVLGWGGDGSPDGTLRGFAIGAVVQHFPLTMQRRAAPSCLAFDPDEHDFCLPDTDQLCALEAFQKSLGRDSEFDFAALDLFDSDTGAGNSDVEAARDFFGDPAKANCQFCHVNGGATSGQQAGEDFNSNFTTGTEPLLQRIVNAQAGGQFPNHPRPPDGGLGLVPEQDGGGGVCADLDSGSNACGVVELDGSFGDQSFNTPSIIEAADTGPFFHNSLDLMLRPKLGDNITGPFDALEAAVAFYDLTTDPRTSPNCGECAVGALSDFEFFSDRDVRLEVFEIRQMALFLRAVNSLDNIDSQTLPAIQSGICLLEKGSAFPPDGFSEILSLATAHLEDTIDVLEAGDVYPQSVAYLQSARTAVQIAAGNELFASSLLQSSLTRICLARQGIDLATVCPFEPTSCGGQP